MLLHQDDIKKEGYKKKDYMGATTTPHIVHCPLSKINKKKGSRDKQGTSVRCVLRPCETTIYLNCLVSRQFIVYRICTHEQRQSRR